MATELRILGPLEVLEDGSPLDLGAQKHRALLAVLVIHANEVVSTDRLIDALWEDAPPERAQKALQVYVSQLRKVVGRERLLTKAPGYLLRVTPEELDVTRFERLLDEGKPGEALALWRGPPLSDVAYSRFAQREIARLEELRVSALEARIDADLACGRQSGVAGELEALVAEHPLRERLRGQLMLALYRSGRQADALEAYQEGRRALTEELGIEPGRELRELQQAILNQAPGLDLLVADEPEPAQVAASDRETAHELRKTISVLHVAVWTSGADGSPVDPEALRRYAESAQSVVEQAALRHGGTIETRTADGVTGVFGLPVAHEDDALRALRAALDVRHGIGAAVPAAARVEVRLAIATGEVIAGAERTVGEPLSAASRLASLASSGDVLLDVTTHRLLRDLVTVEERQDRWRLLDVRKTPPARRSSPMVGRARDLRRLRDVFDQAAGDRSCQLVTVLGQAGVGKSRLVEELLNALGDGPAVTRGRCLPYGEGITYWPVVEAVREGIRLDDGDTPATARSKLADALGGGPEADTVAELVARTIGISEVEIGTEEGFSAVRTLFEGLAQARPLVIVFDDIHWGEQTFLDLVDHLADRVRDAPVMLVCTARPELFEARPAWGGGKQNATSILLGPLSDGECERLIESLVDAENLDDETTTRIVEAAEGNPLFAEEMLALVLEDDSRRGEIAVPPTIHALLAARLDQLPPEERSALGRAAVIGKVFYEGALADMTPVAEREGIHASLESLVYKQLVRPTRQSLGESAYAFRHLLIRDAAYDSIPKETRSVLHERFGRWLEVAAGERTIEQEEFVGYHFEQAFRYRIELGAVDDAARALAREAAERLGEAGRRAFVRGDGPAGVNLVSRAVALLSPDDPLRVELVPNVRVVQGLHDDLDWADRALTESIEAAATTGDRVLAAHALVQRGLLRLFTAPDVTADELIDTADRAISVFDGCQDDLGLARAWRLVAQAHYLGRRAAASADAAERALVHASQAGDRFEEREIEEWLMIALAWGPMPADEAATRCQRILDDSGSDPVRESQVLGVLTLLMVMQARFDEGRELASRARRSVEGLGEGIWIVSFHLAQALLWHDDPAAAEAELRPHYELLKRIGEKSHFSPIAHLLADAAYAQERFGEAEQLARECEEVARPNDVHDETRWRAIRAKVLARANAFDEAEAVAREAVSMAARSDFLVAHAAALMDLAEVLELAGKAEESAAVLAEAVRYYELKGNVAGADRAHARLATAGAT